MTSSLIVTADISVSTVSVDVTADVEEVEESGEPESDEREVERGLKGRGRARRKEIDRP